MFAARKFIGAVLAAASLVAVVSCLSACGGGGDSASASEPLTKAQFIKRASTICESEEARKTSRLTAASKLGRGYIAGSKQELTRLVADEVFPLYGEMIGELAELSPPAGDEAEVKRLIDQYEKKLNEVEANPREFVFNDTFVKINLAAGKYGIKSCTL